MDNTLATPLSVCEPAPRRPLLVRIGLWLSLWSERRSLARLSPHMLADIGVTQEAMERESQRAPWDVPSNRMGW